MKQSRLVFINPPGTEPFIRGYFCSQTSKADYLIQPIDFICLSGFLAPHFELHLIDAIRDRLSLDQVLDTVRAWRPEVVICLVGMVSHHEDTMFIRALKETGVPTVAALGDLLLDEHRPPGELLPGLDLVLHSFIDDPGLRPCPNGSAPRNDSPAVLHTPAQRTFELPIPRHSLFLHPGYSLPFARHGLHATVLTDFGCPYSCRFCVMSTLGYRVRPVENVVAELESLHALGVQELFIIDQSFGVVRPRCEAILETMIRRQWKFGWTCYSRVDLVDREFLTLMKKAGCHTIMFGVESGSEAILEAYQKGYTLSQIRRTFHLCRKLGLRTVGTFLLGFPEDTQQSCRATIDLACSLHCTFASFNFAFPRKRTILSSSQNPREAGDQSGRHLSSGTRFLSIQDLEQLRNEAIRRFYFRPGYLLRQLLGIRGLHQLKTSIKNGFSLLKRIF